MSTLPEEPAPSPVTLPVSNAVPIAVEQILADMAQQSRTLEACIAINKARLFPVLAAAGIVEIEVTYYGEGDSGGIEELRCLGPNNSAIELPSAMITLQSTNWNGTNVNEQELALSDAIEAFALDVIECRFAGWENNDGATGTVSFCVAEARITLSHGTKSVSYDHAEF